MERKVICRICKWYSKLGLPGFKDREYCRRGLFSAIRVESLGERAMPSACPSFAEVGTMHKVALWNAFDWIPKSFPADCLVITYDTGRARGLRYHKEHLTVTDCTHVSGRILRRSVGRKGLFLAGEWHVEELASDRVVRVQAYNADYSILLNTFVKPGCGIPEMTVVND